jgi:hypothetical protein
VQAREIIDDIPGDASVSAQYSLTAQLARRDEIYMFPNPFSTELYGPDDRVGGQRLAAADRIEFVVLPASLDSHNQLVWDRESAAFTLVDANDWWRLYRRTSTIGSG